MNSIHRSEVLKPFDINCDMGEIAITWQSGRDISILPLLSSINVSCGAHAGNTELIKETVKEAITNGLKIGAHPSFPDMENFGRKALDITLAELGVSLTEQILSLKKIVELSGGNLHHIKPHGALYNLAAKDGEISMLICEILKSIDDNLILFCPPNSITYKIATELGISVWRESFIDRVYKNDGSLVDREIENAVIKNSTMAYFQFENLKKGYVLTNCGKQISVASETFCIHGDNEAALEILLKIRDLEV